MSKNKDIVFYVIWSLIGVLLIISANSHASYYDHKQYIQLIQHGAIYMSLYFVCIFLWLLFFSKQKNKRHIKFSFLILVVCFPIVKQDYYYRCYNERGSGGLFPSVKEQYKRGKRVSSTEEFSSRDAYFVRLAPLADGIFSLFIRYEYECDNLSKSFIKKSKFDIHLIERAGKSNTYYVHLMSTISAILILFTLYTLINTYINYKTLKK